MRHISERMPALSNCLDDHTIGGRMHPVVTAVVAAVIAANVALTGARAEAMEPRDALDYAALLATSAHVQPDIVYLTVGGWNGKLDLFLPRRPRGPMPVALLFHGGGWVTGSKDEISLDAAPYLAMGFAVANVDYRLAQVARAPAAVQDARCALRWVIRHAPQYGLDPARVVTVGSSAGAHLALMAALAPPSAGFDGLCPGDEPLHVAAVINFFGVVDAEALLAPPSPRDFALGWFGPEPAEPAARAERLALARRVSPLSYVAAGAPPVMTVHGEADPVVPYEQATRLHAALTQAHVVNRLVPIRGGKHGDFDGNEVLRLNRAVRDFLVKQRIVVPETKRQAKVDSKRTTTEERSRADGEVVISSARGR
jgi:acetyl esterase/lipase